MICKNCGAELLDDVKFCTNCGMPTAPAQQENYSSYNDQAYPPQDSAPVQYYPPQQEYSNQQPYPRSIIRRRVITPLLSRSERISA